jgi:type I restriction enzyme S subunit
MASFDEVLKDCTKLGTKIQTSEYLKNGTYPIIDQGQDNIAGYFDTENGLFKDVPAIVFGDHTRIVKYIDKPCFLGADGVKLLCPVSKNTNCKYLFYQLAHADIPNTGYNRHFKWVKALEFKIPFLEEQNHIVNVLDKISTLITFRKQQLAKLDELVKARFVEMFGNKDYPRMKWNDVFNTTTGKLDSNAAVANGKYPFFTCSKEPLKIDSYAFDQTALLLTGNNAAGKYDVKYYQGKFNAYQRTYVLSLKHNWSYKLFQYQLEDKLLYLQTKSLGGLTKYLTLKILGELDFIVPPLALQNEFAAFVEHVDEQKQTVQQSLEKLELMKKALMQEYFG